MRNIIILLMIVGCGYLLYGQYAKPTIVAGEPYIEVYGRDRCSITTSMRKFLDNKGIPYQYYSIDNRKNADNLHAKMRLAGISTRSYYLPVVDINGKILVRPTRDIVQSLYFNSN